MTVPEVDAPLEEHFQSFLEHAYHKTPADVVTRQLRTAFMAGAVTTLARSCQAFISADDPQSAILAVVAMQNEISCYSDKIRQGELP